MESVLAIAGWGGGVLVGIAYALVSLGRIHAQSPTFQLLNVVGGALLTWTALDHGALSNAVIDLVWVGFGLYTLVILRRGRGKRSGEQGQGETVDQSGRPSESEIPTVEMPAV